MGSTQSAPVLSDGEYQGPLRQDAAAEDDNDEDVEGEEHVGGAPTGDEAKMAKKILQQEPEMLPFHASASPLSPQPSAHNTPRLGPSIKVWDPYNVLAPPPPFLAPPHFPRNFSTPLADNDRGLTEVYLISHGECHMKLRPDLIAGRCPDAALTPCGRRQARALAVFLKSLGVRFNSVYTSNLDRARATALSVCQELSFPEESIQSSDALAEMSYGHWEGCHKSEIFTPETASLMEKSQPDFCAPSGESLRQVEFRMVQFLNIAIVPFPEKFTSDFSPPDPVENPHGSSLAASHWDLINRHRQGLPRKKSGKSRLQIVTSTADHEADDEMSPRQPSNLDMATDPNSMERCNSSLAASCVGVFSHPTPIKCLLTGLLGCSPAMSHKMCIDDSSVTVLQHSWKLGWQIRRVNDTSHLRLL